jgi:hypothetical protein
MFQKEYLLNFIREKQCNQYVQVQQSDHHNGNNNSSGRQLNPVSVGDNLFSGNQSDRFRRRNFSPSL